MVISNTIVSASECVPASAAMPSDLKIQNRMRVLGTFRDGRAHTASDVSAATGISKLTVMRAIQFFCAKNVLVAAGKGNSTDVGGKKPEYYRLLALKQVLSITLWPGNLNFALYDLLCNRISFLELSTPLYGDIDAVFAQVADAVKPYLKNNAVQSDTLYGVALSTAGTIDYATKRLKYSSLNPNWGTDIPVCDYLANIFGTDKEFFVENAGKMTGRSALLDPSLQDKRVLVLFSTWGLSACLIENGRILSGKDSLIGEIGHMVIDAKDEELCGCGGHGCFERLIDIRRIRKRIEKNPPPSSSPLSSLCPDKMEITDIFSASAQEDEYARAIVDSLAKLFSLALHNISLVFNPDVVIFQGDYAHADSYFDAMLKRELMRFRYYPSSGAFETVYDKRSLFELDAKGAAVTLSDLYFADFSLYADEILF